MSKSRAFSLYEKLPVALQNVACSAAGVQMRRTRYNRTFREALALLDESQWWPLERQEADRDARLGAILRHAYDSVPYYREIFDERGLTPDDIRTQDDLPAIPILTKQIIRERFDDLQSQSWPHRKRIHGHTGGTTGTALHLVQDPDTQPWQWAVWWRHRQRFGLRVSDPFVVFAGRMVVPLEEFRPPFWRRNLPMRQTYVSIHHMTRPNMPVLVDYLQTRNVTFYSGYPSALYLLAMHLLDGGIRLKHPPRVTVTGAETLLPHQRRVIEEAFETEIGDQYGASENCGNISECERHTYHVDMEFGAVEFAEMDGLPDRVRRILCTGFHNRAMPLIRYDIGDLATLGAGACACGREAPTVEKIDGRIESYIITPDGRQHGRLDFLFKESQHIEEAQLIQDTDDHLTAVVVRSRDYSEADEQSLLKDMRIYLGDEIRIDIEYAAEIPREANGKFRQIVSKVFEDRYKTPPERIEA